MSVMQSGELEELAAGLVQLLDIQIPENTNPLQPGIIISALAILFPDAEPQLQEIIQFDQFEQQWNCILEFIQINILDGQRLEVQALGIEEIAEIYQLLIEYSQQALQEIEFQQKETPKKDLPEKSIKQNQQKKSTSKEKQIKKQGKKKIPEAGIQKKKLEKKNERKKQNEDNLSKKEKKKENIVGGGASKSKSKDKPHSNSKNQKSNKNTGEVKQTSKASPTQAAKMTSLVENEPMQNQVIKQITAAMKGNQKMPKNKILMKDPKSTQEVMKAKRQFQHYLNQFKRQGKVKHKVDSKQKKSGLDQNFLKALQKRQKNIQQTVINQQLKYFLTLRDKKVAFINKIHKLTEQLERQRLVQKQKEQRRIMDQQRAKTQSKIQQSNALFNKNMELLKENYKAIRQKNELQNYDERIICKQMQQCMKKKKLNELQELKMLWEQQNMKLNNIMGDEQKIKNKLIDIYRKNRP